MAEKIIEICEFKDLETMEKFIDYYDKLSKEKKDNYIFRCFNCNKTSINMKNFHLMGGIVGYVGGEEIENPSAHFLCNECHDNVFGPDPDIETGGVKKHG